VLLTGLCCRSQGLPISLGKLPQRPAHLPRLVCSYQRGSYGPTRQRRRLSAVREPHRSADPEAALDESSGSGSNLTYRRTYLVSNERADDRRVISGIVHVVKSGCRWCDCPPEYGPPTTIYSRFVRWARRGVWETLFRELAGNGRSIDCR